jgi:hypothetical protein
MIEYIKNFNANFPEEITTTKTSLAADHLFKVQDNSKAKPLPEEQAMAFHHATFWLGGQINFCIVCIHTHVNTTFYVGISTKITKLRPKTPPWKLGPLTPPLPHLHPHRTHHC